MPLARLRLDFQALKHGAGPCGETSLIEKRIVAIGRKAAVANRVVKKDDVLSIIPFAIQIPANRFELLNKEALVSGQQSGARELAPTVQRAENAWNIQTRRSAQQPVILATERFHDFCVANSEIGYLFFAGGQESWARNCQIVHGVNLACWKDRGLL